MKEARTRRALFGATAALACALVSAVSGAQSLPATQAETLSGKPIVLAQAVRGHAAVLIASFSKDAGPDCDAWARAARADVALAGIAVYQAAMLQRAPALVRLMIKSSLRKQVPAAQQDHFLVFSQDDALWRSYFAVTTDKEPYAVLIDADGKIRWHGHGDPQFLEPLLKDALK